MQRKIKENKNKNDKMTKWNLSHKIFQKQIITSDAIRKLDFFPFSLVPSAEASDMGRTLHLTQSNKRVRLFPKTKWRQTEKFLSYYRPLCIQSRRMFKGGWNVILEPRAISLSLWLAMKQKMGGGVDSAYVNDMHGILDVTSKKIVSAKVNWIRFMSMI